MKNNDKWILLQGPLLDKHFLPGGYHYQKRFEFLSQGINPDENYKIICDYYKQYINDFNIIWVTWKNEPQEAIDYIRQSGIEIHLLDEPTSPGRQNVNYQIISSVYGVEYIKNNGGIYVLKIRDDMILEPINIAYDIMLNKYKYNDKLCSLFYRHDLQFMTDYFMFGNVNEMLLFWNADLLDGTFPEDKLLFNYFSKKQINHDKSFENLQKYFNFVAGEFIDNSVEVNWIKYRYNPVKEIHDLIKY